MPPPNSQGMVYLPNRKEAIAAAAVLETPAEALARVKAGGTKPAHYVPTPPIPESELTRADTERFNPYTKAQADQKA
jgi:hypothetical protein